MWSNHVVKHCMIRAPGWSIIYFRTKLFRLAGSRSHWLLQDEVITIDWESIVSPMFFIFFFGFDFFHIGDLYKYGTRIATHLDGSYCKLWCAIKWTLLSSSRRLNETGYNRMDLVIRITRKLCHADDSFHSQFRIS